MRRFITFGENYPMSKHTKLFVIAIFTLLVVACKHQKAVSDTDMEAQGFVKAMVVSYDVDGCGYLLQLTDKSRLEPDGLQPEFQKDSLPVWIKYKAAPDRMSVCMAGATIDLLEIKKR
jgi:hypothetical protein